MRGGKNMLGEVSVRDELSACLPRHLTYPQMSCSSTDPFRRKWQFVVMDNQMVKLG